MRSSVRQAMAIGQNASEVGRAIVEQLQDPALRIAFVFADWQLDCETLAAVIHRGLAPARVVGGTTIGVIHSSPERHRNPHDFCAVGLGLYGDWVRVGVGVAAELPRSALARSRDAVETAAGELGIRAEALDPHRHVGVTLVDGTCGHEESFCIGSAAAAPQIRFAGGSVSTKIGSSRRASIWVDGRVASDAGLVVLIDSEVPCIPVKSAHMIPTEVRTVVTAASGRVIHELDGHPAAPRLRELLERLGGGLEGEQPSAYSFARYVDGTPYVRALTHFEGDQIHLASGVEPGHVLRVMQPGDLIGTTRRDLAIAAERVGGTIGALLAFSCISRHWEASAKGGEAALDQAYAAYPTIGFQSSGEQFGMLLVNTTVTGLAIGTST